MSMRTLPIAPASAASWPEGRLGHAIDEQEPQGDIGDHEVPDRDVRVGAVGAVGDDRATPGKDGQIELAVGSQGHLDDAVTGPSLNTAGGR
jgi:hypothetical protein